MKLWSYALVGKIYPIAGCDILALSLVRAESPEHVQW